MENRPVSSKVGTKNHMDQQGKSIVTECRGKQSTIYYKFIFNKSKDGPEECINRHFRSD
jgi:hypothetical protein